MRLVPALVVALTLGGCTGRLVGDDAPAVGGEGGADGSDGGQGDGAEASDGADDSGGLDSSGAAPVVVHHVTLQDGFEVPATGVDLATGEVIELSPSTSQGREHGNLDLGVVIAYELSLGSLRGEDDAPTMLCQRGAFDSVTDVPDDEAGCEWTQRIYFGGNTGDEAFLDALVGTAILARDEQDGARYRLLVVDGSVDGNTFTLSFDLAGFE